MDGSCNCASKKIPEDCSEIMNFLNPSRLNLNLMSSIFQVVASQTTLIQKIQSNLNELQSSIPKFIPQVDEMTTASKLLSFLNDSGTNYNHSIHLLDTIPKPVYKDRLFSFSVEILDLLGNKSLLPQGALLEIRLYTTECPSIRIESSTSGELVVSWIVEDLGTSSFIFRKVNIKEVTSHFRNGCLLFVIICKNIPNIRPLVIEDLIVKARKIPSQKSSKKSLKTKDPQ